MLRKARQDSLEAWARGAYIGDNPNESWGMNAKALGALDIVEQIINLSYEDIEESFNGQ